MILVVGGGVVGLHVAIALALRPNHPEILLLEREKILGDHTSGRNSEVIHAGFAYPEGSLKAKFCVEGNHLSYEWLKKLSVPYKNCGKWLVAFTPEEVPALAATLENGRKCGVEGMREMNPAELKKKEVSTRSFAGAIFCDTSGMMDAADYMKALERYFVSQEDCMLIQSCELRSIDPAKKQVQTSRGPISYSWLINCAGLFADDVYQTSGGKRDFQIKPFKGEYYIWRKGKINEVIYPVPRRFLPGGEKDKRLVSSMGIHLHRAVSGDLFVGPTQVELDWNQKTDYTLVTPKWEFVRQARLYVEDINEEDLQPAYAGNRPKLYEDGKPSGDFLIVQEGVHIHVLGTDSPGLTAAPSIAKEVSRLVDF